MKRKKFLIYLGAGILPLVIFAICCFFNKFLPFKDELLNSYDSFTQYPGMLLEYANLLRSGSIFYSWHGGLGFNFFGSLTYYGMSPLNLLSLFATPLNYHIFIVIMTYLRITLAALSMCYYLEHKGGKPWQIIVFSTIYALMGFISTYYYNYLWIDSIIMLPLVIHGLDKLIDECQPKFYIITLALVIFMNYYIGYMICIFSVIWFLYKLPVVKNKKEIIKTFLMSSILAGLISSITILPSFFALLVGKGTLYGEVDYFNINCNLFTFFYNHTSGTYLPGDQMNGPALVYSTILVFVLTIFYFFNNSFSKKEKISTLIILLVYYLSFSINLLNYAWQFFQKPIWWPSRFAFTYSFFLISLAFRTLSQIEKTDFKIKYRVLTTLIIIVLFAIGAYFKWANAPIENFTYLFFGFSILLFVEMMFLLDKKSFWIIISVFTIVDLTINTFNSLKGNYVNNSYRYHSNSILRVSDAVENLKKEDDSFYRMELLSSVTSNDGLYFNYNGIGYFNSVRNKRVMNMLSNLGITVYNECNVEFKYFDPIILSLLNVKYLYGEKIDYLEWENNINKNTHPLALGFASNASIKNLELEDDYIKNKENILNSLTGLDEEYYISLDYTNFEKRKEDYRQVYTYSFVSDGNYLLMPPFNSEASITVVINEKSYHLDNIYKKNIHKGDEVEITYSFVSYHENADVYLNLFSLDKFDYAISLLENSLLDARTNINGHILEGSIDIQGEYDYLFTSIEYEQGMKVYVDGKLVEPEIILDSLIGLPLNEGHHTITIDYIPKGFKTGLVLSIISIIVTVIYLQKRKNTL